VPAQLDPIHTRSTAGSWLVRGRGRVCGDLRRLRLRLHVQRLHRFPAQQDFGASRGSVSLVFSLAGFLYFGLGCVSGPLADRWGSRRLAVIGMFVTGIGPRGRRRGGKPRRDLCRLRAWRLFRRTPHQRHHRHSVHERGDRHVDRTERRRLCIRCLAQLPAADYRRRMCQFHRRRHRAPAWRGRLTGRRPKRDAKVLGR
jgi:hypothetical protein